MRKCHNERSQSDFQLIESRSRRDLTNELLVRANLDATLRLVDREELARSPLLTALGMAHGPSNKPIVNGPNHPSYRMVLTWVNGLKPPAAAPDEAIARGGSEAATPPVEAFAADRRPALEGATAPPRPNAPRTATPKVPAPAPAPGPPPSTFDPQFPTPTLGGGSNPAPVTVRGKSFTVVNPPGGSPRVVEASPPPAIGQAPATLKVPKGAKTITLPDGSVVPYVNVRRPAREKPRNRRERQTEANEHRSVLPREVHVQPLRPRPRSKMTIGIESPCPSRTPPILSSRPAPIVTRSHRPPTPPGSPLAREPGEVVAVTLGNHGQRTPGDVPRLPGGSSSRQVRAGGVWSGRRPLRMLGSGSDLGPRRPPRPADRGRGPAGRLRDRGGPIDDGTDAAGHI